MKRLLWLPALIISAAIAVGLAALCVPRLAAQAPAAQARFVFPNTPAARQLQAWLAAFTSGDRATIQSFVQKVMTPGAPSNFVDQTIAMRGQMGGLDFQRVEESTEDRIVAIAQTRISRERLRITVEVDAAEPHRIAQISLEPVSPPASTPPPPEMTPAQAAFARTQPSTHQFFAWLAAFNSGDRAQYLRFLQNNFPNRVSGLDQDMDFRANTGGFEFKKLEQASPTRAGGLVQERDSDQFARFTLEVEPVVPHRIVSLGLAAIPRPAAFPIPRLTESQAVAAVKALLDKDTAADRFSGAVLVAKNGRTIFSGAYGLADREKKIPDRLDTRFRIGSMNKMFTAVSVLQLVEAGKIKLTDPVGKYITDYPNHEIAAKVTIHELLTHTGGTGDIFGPEFDTHRLELRTLNDYVALYGKRGPEFAPGSRWAYSNYGMVLAGAVIGRVTHQSYYDYVQEHVYKPAGMTSSGSLPEDQGVANRSVGYMRSDSGGWKPNTGTLPYRGTSAGGGYSTVGDLVRFATALLSHKLLNATYTDLLITGKVATGRGPGKYAYGFEDERDKNGNGYVGHGGGAPGMNGDLRIYPKSGYVVAVLANLDPPAAQRISEYVDSRLPQ
ncbi:MAG: serine hydrolase domain-containing protein [Terriglobia bacterium]|jgi:CubicO group peptidase (beta-lactamase class C family)